MTSRTVQDAGTATVLQPTQPRSTVTRSHLCRRQRDRQSGHVRPLPPSARCCPGSPCGTLAALARPGPGGVTCPPSRGPHCGPSSEPAPGHGPPRRSRRPGRGPPRGPEHQTRRRGSLTRWGGASGGGGRALPALKGSRRLARGHAPASRTVS